MTERIFDIIKDPDIIKKEESNEFLRRTCMSISDMIDQMEKNHRVFSSSDKISLQLSDMKDCMIKICDYLDEEFDDE